MIKCLCCFILSFCFVLLAGCGDFEWFPENTFATQPILTNAFNTSSNVVVGSTATLTFTISNASGNAAQSNLGFTDTFPAGTFNGATMGLMVANPPNVTNTCGGNVYGGGTTTAVAAGDTSITFSGGSIGAGPATCTVSVDVTSNAATTFLTGTGNVSITGPLSNGVTSQSIAFSPFTQTGVNGTVSARDLVVNANGSPQFSLLLDNTGNAVNVRATVQGTDASGTAVTEALPGSTTVFPLAAGAVGQQLSLSGIAPDTVSSVKVWKISQIAVNP